MNTYDSESNFATMESSFSEKAIRMGFIRKVYGILMVQLAITVSFIAIFLYVDGVKQYTQRNEWMFWVAFVMVIVLMITLACCGTVRRTYPINLICLFLFTLAESFLLGVSASRYNHDEVMIAVGICAVVCLGLTLFAFQTKFDFTMCGGFLLVAVIVLLCFGIMCIIIQNRYANLVYTSLGVLIFSMFLVYDTQLMLGGTHKYSISPEEYIFAALNLYVDVINLFMYILQLVSAARN